MIYTTLRLVHMSAVAVSFAGFVVRGFGRLRGSSWLGLHAVRVIPHGVDTVLLLSAIGMLWQLRLSPAAAPWLQAKIAGLLVYILLGSLALRPDRPGGASRPAAVRAAAWIGALLVFGYIVSVAMTKDPWGVLMHLPRR